MKLPPATRICCRCGQRYAPCCFNAHHQACCPDPKCQLENRQERDRNRYRRKYNGPDATFREEEKARRSAARRQEPRTALPVPVPPSVAVLLDPALGMQLQRLTWMVTGFVGAMTGESDPVFIHELASNYAAAGQRLSVGQDSS